MRLLHNLNPQPFQGDIPSLDTVCAKYDIDFAELDGEHQLQLMRTRAMFQDKDVIEQHMKPASEDYTPGMCGTPPSKLHSGAPRYLDRAPRTRASRGPRDIYEYLVHRPPCSQEPLWALTAQLCMPAQSTTRRCAACSSPAFRDTQIPNLKINRRTITPSKLSCRTVANFSCLLESTSRK